MLHITDNKYCFSSVSVCIKLDSLESFTVYKVVNTIDEGSFIIDEFLMIQMGLFIGCDFYNALSADKQLQ